MAQTRTLASDINKLTEWISAGLAEMWYAASLRLQLLYIGIGATIAFGLITWLTTGPTASRQTGQTLLVVGLTAAALVLAINMLAMWVERKARSRRR